MKGFANLCIGTYSRLLRLYPARFQDEYAEEMRTVFEQMVMEREDALALMGLMAGEVWDLPASLVREYSRERKLRLQGDYFMTAAVIPIRAFRFLVGVLVGILILYGLLILLPYFYNGLNNVSWDALMGGSYDPKGYPPFVDDGIVGVVTRLVGFIVLICGPVMDIAMGGILMLNLRRHWRMLRHNQRMWGLAGILAAVSLLALTFSPFGHALFIWFVD